MKNNALNERWLDEEVLGYNSIAYSDGSVVLLNLIEVNNKVIITPYAGSSIKQIEQFEIDPWTSIQCYSSIYLSKKNLMFFYGEGAMGNEGFVACLKDNEVCWTLFLNKFNPVINGLLLDNQFVQFNTEYIELIINIDNPIEISAKRFSVCI